jgi:ligand-binding sensor domain-containing protein/serine phosphatase RsbU (regulator of sigma subunit)
MKYLWIIALLFITETGFAQESNQEPRLELKSLNIENGLSQNTVNALLEDKDGFLWIGTDDGLNRYDGQNITIYKHIRSDATTIPDNQIMSLYEDNQGHIWVGTLAGLALYDNNTNQFTSFRKDETTKDSTNSLVDNNVKAITQDKDGFLWIGTTNGLSKLDTKTTTFTNYTATENDSLLLGSNTINKLIVDKNNNLWIGTTKGLNKWNSERVPQNVYRSYRGDFTNPVKLYVGNILSILCAKDGKVWIGTRGALHLYKPDTNDFERYLYENKITGIQSILEEANGNLWAAGYGYIYKLNVQTKELIKYRPSLEDLGTMPALVRTKENIIWAASRNLGVVYFNPSKSSFQLYKAEENNKNSLPHRNVWSVIKSKDSIVWVGTDVGLSRIDRSGIIPEYYHIKQGEGKYDFKIGSIANLLQTREGEFWIIGGEDISRLISFSEKEGAKFTTLVSDAKDSTTIQVKTISTFQDKKQTIWIGTFAGLYKLEPTTENEFGYKAKPFYKELYIWHIHEDKQGVLWLASNKGLIKTKRNEANDIVDATFYKSDPNDLSSISNNVIRAIAEDSKGNLWLGTTNGLNKMNTDANGKVTFEHWGERNELANYAIYGILVDENDNLWISTNRGIFKFLNDKESQNLTDDRRIIVYDTRDNLQSVEFNSGAFFKADDGEMFFGGIGGLNSFYPKDILPNTEKRKVILTDLKLFGETVKVNQEENDRILLPQALKNLDKLELTYQDKIITIEFVSPNFNKPEYDTYLYKLDGFDKDWNKTKKIRQATYTNLSAGNYTLRVKVVNGDNIESEETILKISVSPPFWKTWWFITLCGLVVASASVGFYRHKLNSVKAQNTKLEGLVNERTSQLKEKNDEVNQRNEEINQQNEEIVQQNQKLETQQKLVETAYQNVSQLSEVGKQITSSLSIEMIVEMVYESVNKLLDASVFSIGIYNEKEQTLDFINTKEKGETLPFHQTFLTTDNLPCYCFNKNAEFVINDMEKEYTNFIPNQERKALEGENTESLIYVPIIYKNEIIGVLTVQSFEKDSYSENQLNLVRNIAVYAAIALINAKSYQKIEQQSNAISIQNNNINASISYASRIQQAMLPPIADIKNALDNAFVLWLPRDVVSGDFYWFAKVEDKICIAAVDCTGHGVPGAFMSMIGNDMLNHIVLEKRITNPAAILTHLHQQVSTALRQSETQNRDGMDMSLCVYDTQTKELTFAGAKNPLYYIQNGELKDIAGSKFPIGGKWGEERERVYENHLLKIDQETTIFLCTDGYQDQFGGNKGRKLMRKKMKSLFVEIADLEDVKQKEKLENYFVNWKKEEEQVDDVLVMGFKVG